METVKTAILLVEDEFIVAMVEQKELEAKGYIVHHVSKGEDAVKTIIDAAVPVDLILMDIELGPGIDGTQAAKQILEHIDVPIVFLSSHTEPEVVEKTEKITSYGYVVKNTGITVLDASIKMALKLFGEKTERRRAEEALLESESKFKTLVDQAGDALFLHTIDGRIVDVNRVTAERYGYTRQELLKLTAAVIDPDYVQRGDINGYWEKLIAEGTISFEARHRRKNGTIFPVEITINGVVLSGSRYIMALARDISERKKAEIDLIRMNERLQLSYEAADAGAWDWDVKTGHIEWTPKMFDLLGLDPGRHDASFEAWRTSLHPDDLASAESNIMAALRDHVTLYNEYRVIQPGGDIRWIYSVGKGFYDVTGEPIRMVGICIDITERKKAEDALKLAQERNTSIINGIFDTFYSLDTEWRFTTVNPAAEKAPFARPAGELLGRVIWDLYPKLIGTHIHQHYLNASKNQSLEHYEAQSPLNGRWYDVFMKGWKNGIDVYLRDITERKSAEEEIEKQLSEKETLLKEIHHRVKNNISNIENLLSMQAGSCSSPEAQSALHDAVARVASMRTLYDRLLVSEDYHEISMKKYIESLINAIIVLFPESGKVLIDTEIVDFSISAKKATAVGIIFNELLTNVFKHAFRDRESGRVSVNLVKADSVGTLTVYDDGNGIDERIALNKSAGFGLTIVKMLTNQLQGTFSIQNKNGTKTVVQFGL